MEFAYTARTQAGTFLLDAEGVCRAVLPSLRGVLDASLETCIGAQFVASLDAAIEGCLAVSPRIGAFLLFARSGADGRVQLLRAGRLDSFEKARVDESGVHVRVDEAEARSATPVAVIPVVESCADDLDVDLAETDEYECLHTGEFEAVAAPPRAPPRPRRVPAPPPTEPAIPSARAKARSGGPVVHASPARLQRSMAALLPATMPEPTIAFFQLAATPSNAPSLRVPRVIPLRREVHRAHEEDTLVG